MNAKIKKLALMTAMLALTHTMPPIEREVATKKDTSYLRKKCKSCKLFSCNDNRHKWRSNPMAQACEKYEHR
jgi:hypothetical protein